MAISPSGFNVLCDRGQVFEVCVPAHFTHMDGKKQFALPWPNFWQFEHWIGPFFLVVVFEVNTMMIYRSYIF